MSDKASGEARPVSFGQRLANSPAFMALFREGMALVEETATYLDGPGRDESKALSRVASLTYATESMRLTTRLMQLASWLLLHRAVNEGEMSLSQANKEKHKVKLTASEDADPSALVVLPPRLVDLVEKTRALAVKVARLDATIHAPESAPSNSNPLEGHLRQLKAAFGGERD